MDNTITSKAVITQATFLNISKQRWPVLVLAFVAFSWAIVVSAILFPFYSNNHDEPVYILQAQTLLDGRLTLPANEFFDDFFTPWFVMLQGDRAIFKYTPVHAAFLALGQLLFGSMRAMLGVVAAGNVILFYRLGRELCLGKPAVWLATIFFLCSPFFLIQSATYLSYTTALLLYLCFAVFLLRGSRNQAWYWLVCAGLALGLALFARPYDAILFAIPFGIFFITLNWDKSNQLLKQTIWLCLGFLPILGLTLVYNAWTTGQPFRFPFALYETLDTFGFGYRRQHPLDEPVLYDFSAAIQALWANLFQLNYWVFGGALLLGIALFQLIRHPLDRRQGLLFGLLVIFPVGYFFFWGPYNFTRWGILEYLGPMYYLPLLVPVAILGAQGILHLSRPKPIIAWGFVGLMCLVTGLLLYRPIVQNYAYTREHQAIYRPFLEQQLDNALVFLPPLKGPVLLHPFAYLGNTPTLDGPVIYAVNRDEKNLTLLDAYPNRMPYRFDYYGDYTEDTDDEFETSLVGLERLRTGRFAQHLRLVNPGDRPYVFAEVWNNRQGERYLLDDASAPGRGYDVEWVITPDGVEFSGPYQEHRSSLTTLSPNHELVVSVSFSDDPEQTTKQVFERRFVFAITADHQLDMLLPPEEWRNSYWPLAKWEKGDVGQVMQLVQETGFTQKLRLVNPTDNAYVYAYIWNNHQTETYLLDDASEPGKSYDIEWFITPDWIGFRGKYQQHLDSIANLSPDQPLSVAVAFSDDAARASQNIFERRFRFDLTDNGQIKIISPPEEWHNPFWPVAEWQKEDIDEVMADR
jgi:hypothetical protein